MSESETTNAITCCHVIRTSIAVAAGEVLLTKCREIDIAFFSIDDMTPAVHNVMKAHWDTKVLIGGANPVPPALADGRMHATVRKPSLRVHDGSIVTNVTEVVDDERTSGGSGTIPKNIITGGPMVTKVSACTMMWVEHFFV